MSLPFFKLTTLSCADAVREHVRSLTKDDWKSSDSFQIAQVPRELFKNDPMLKLIDEYGYGAEVFRMPAFSQYLWHVDRTRNAAVNVLLDSTNSMSLFERYQAGALLSFMELKYEQDMCYLLNTQVRHSVVNLQGLRDVLSIGIPKSVTYDDAKRFCITNICLGS